VTHSPGTHYSIGGPESLFRAARNDSNEATMATATILDFTKPHVLRNAREYRAAVSEIDEFLDADPGRGTDAYNRLEFLSVLVEAYEDERDPIDETGGTPQSIVAFMLEQREMTRSDLAPLMGGKARVSEFFAGKRRLSLEQVRSLRDALGIPADLLIA
jgi:HTH-type transcriptional regulator / antitoxin HigA